MPDALLVMVHGSPRTVANEPMFRVVERLKAHPEAVARFPIVAVGFMECNEPDIPTAIDQCVGQGATAVVAVPYFVHLGTHVADDLPTLLQAAQEKYPQVAFRMGDYLGLSPRLTDLLERRIAAASKD